MREQQHRALQIGDRVFLTRKDMSGTAQVTGKTESVLWMEGIEMRHRDGYRLATGLGMGMFFENGD